MLSHECKECKYVIWLVALGQGVRCSNLIHNEKNQADLPITISKIKNCNFKKVKLIKR